MNVSQALEGTEGNVGDVSNKIDLVMAANTNESKENNNNDNYSCVDGNDIVKKGAEIMANIFIEENVKQGRWDYTNKYNKWEGGDFLSVDEEHNQNRMLVKQACVDKISKVEVANICLSFNRKNRLDDSFNDEEHGGRDDLILSAIQAK